MAKNKNWKIRLGIILMIVSVPLFLFLPAIPFLQIGNKEKLALITLIFAEVLFWLGGLLVGKELFSKYKSYFNPKNWFKKKIKKEK